MAAGPGIRLEVDVTKWRRAIEQVRDLEDRRELMESIAELGANQAKRRIKEEKRSPEGIPWKPWDPDYAKTRKSQHSLLVDSGHLMGDAIRGDVDNDQNILIVADVNYAGPQQSTRPFLGVSDANAREIEGMINRWVESVL